MVAGSFTCAITAFSNASKPARPPWLGNTKILGMLNFASICEGAMVNGVFGASVTPGPSWGPTLGMSALLAIGGHGTIGLPTPVRAPLTEA